jgi:histone-lysine N-methyltransferase EZH2
MTPSMTPGAAIRPCLNVPSQLSAHKRLCIGRSGVHGWGAFALEPIEKNDFIYEYTGELISQVWTSTRPL